MLRELFISEFVIIEQMRIHFDQGFHVLTGETGAGKSIFIDALGLLMGGRSSADYVRTGAKKAQIEALFEIPSHHSIWQLLKQWGMVDSPQEDLMIRREIASNGKSISRINGQTVTVSMLKQLGQQLIDICGQHEHQSLLHTDEHLSWLDSFAGETLLSKRSEYQKHYSELKKVKQKIAEWNKTEQEMIEQKELYQFQLQEIAAASLIDGEEEQMERERNRLAFAEKLISHSSAAYELLNGENHGLDQIRRAISHLEQVVTIDESLQESFEAIQSSYYQMEEAVMQLGAYRENISFDPDQLNFLEERLHLIQGLKKKYGASIIEVLQYQQKIENQLDKMELADETRTHLEEKHEQLRIQCQVLADELTTLRKKAAHQLETRLEEELRDLHMGATIFHVAFVPIDYQQERLMATGQDLIEFQIAPNPGEPLRPLHKIVSGGEMSRIMLALKCIFTDLQQLQTVVFDEIDTGVSGRTAQAIAERIAVLATHNQILCVTHLPQVACMADHHYYIYKKIEGDKTQTFVEPLALEKRTFELARMLGGVEVTETTREHAQEMLRLANEVKQYKQ